MMTEILQKNSVQKLKGILNDRYGMGLQITSMISVTDMDVRHMSSELRGSSLHVPVCARGKFLATAILSRANSLSTGDVSAVTEMVRLVLEPALFSLYLERQELNSLNQASTESSDSSNLYTFPMHLSQPFSFGNFMRDALHEKIQEVDPVFMPTAPDHKDDSSGWSYDRPEFHSAMILLESYNPHTISRVAVHIHETGNRWALLRYQEIRDTLKTLADFKEMGPLTLLVDDILQLSPEEQRLIVDFAKQADTRTEPLILIGCTSTLTDLIQREMVISDLADIVYESRLELDRMPKEFSKLRETIEMVLDQNSLIGH